MQIGSKKKQQGDLPPQSKQHCHIDDQPYPPQAEKKSVGVSLSLPKRTQHENHNEPHPPQAMGTSAGASSSSSRRTIKEMQKINAEPYLPQAAETSVGVLSSLVRRTIPDRVHRAGADGCNEAHVGDPTSSEKDAQRNKGGKSGQRRVLLQQEVERPTNAVNISLSLFGKNP